MIHNAAFDVAFLDAELARLPGERRQVSGVCQVLDTLMLARELHPGQRNSLDALCKRYEVDNSRRELHGALLDARLLADVYLAMTGGQSALALGDAGAAPARPGQAPRPGSTLARGAEPLQILYASEAECSAHEAMLALIEKVSGGRCVWLAIEGTAGSREPREQPALEPVRSSA